MEFSMKKALFFGLAILAASSILSMDNPKKPRLAMKKKDRQKMLSDAAINLCKAAMAGDIKKVKIYGDICTVNSTSSLHGDTPLSPLHVAVQGACNFECIAHLLNCGARVNTQDENGCTPLHWLMIKKDVEDSLQLLLDRGADISILSDGDVSCLHFLAQTRQLSSLQILLKNGAKKYINVQNDKDNTALHTTLLYYNQRPPFKRSENIRVDIEEDKEQQNLFIQLMLDSGADLFLRNSAGETPYTIAKKNPFLKRMFNRHIQKLKKEKAETLRQAQGERSEKPSDAFTTEPQSKYQDDRDMKKNNQLQRKNQAKQKKKKKSLKKKELSEQQNPVQEYPTVYIPRELLNVKFTRQPEPTGPSISQLILNGFLNNAQRKWDERNSN